MSFVASNPEFVTCPERIRAIIEQIASEPATKAIWFIGSRANGRETPGSDWDILVFSRDEVKPVPARCDGLDVLRVSPSGEVLLEGMSAHLIQPFSRFSWVQTAKTRASYTGQKFLQGEARR